MGTMSELLAVYAGAEGAKQEQPRVDISESRRGSKGGQASRRELMGGEGELLEAFGRAGAGLAPPWGSESCC